MAPELRERKSRAEATMSNVRADPSALAEVDAAREEPRRRVASQSSRSRIKLDLPRTVVCSDKDGQENVGPLTEAISQTRSDAGAS
jgi:hypothetical protein